MHINWFTFIAQIINFLIVLYLLHRFLYGPIRQAMETRQAALAEKFAQAEIETRRAREEAELFRNRWQELESARAQLLDDATKEADERRRAMITTARDEVAAMQQRWYAAVEHEKSLVLQKLRSRVSSQVFDLTRRALADLAGEDIEQAIVNKLTDRFDQISLPEPGASSPPNQNHIHDAEIAPKLAPRIARVRSSFVLSPSIQKQLTAALQTCLGADLDDRPIAVSFDTASHLVCGVEIEFEHMRIAWNVHDYLDQLDDVLEQTLLADRPLQPSWIELQQPSSADGILPG